MTTRNNQGLGAALEAQGPNLRGLFWLTLVALGSRLPRFIAE